MSINIGSLLPRHARYRPRHTCIVFGGRRLDYAAYNARVNRLANALLSEGVVKGDKVATILPNCLELMDLYWAAAKTGAVVVPMSPLLQGTGLRTLLNDSDASMVFAHADFTGVLDAVRDEVPGVTHERWILVGGEAAAPRGYRSFAEMTGPHAEAEPPDAELEDSDIY
ncbi:MAG: AMP-binding protein, partial [Rhodospirillales bacterium]|nr:AMP-binding protein [Rhodospirillales bacterium]